MRSLLCSLRYNQIGDQGANAVAEVLTVNTCLEVLNLNGNSIRAAGASSLTDALRKNRTLTTLHLENNKVSFFTKRAIDSRIRENARHSEYVSRLLCDAVQPSQLKVKTNTTTPLPIVTHTKGIVFFRSCRFICVAMVARARRASPPRSAGLCSGRWSNFGESMKWTCRKDIVLAHVALP